MRTPRYPDLPEGTTEANDLLSSPSETTYIDYKYIKVVLVAERKGLAALRSVVDMLRKSKGDLIKSMAMY
jgi:hypothetical protein